MIKIFCLLALCLSAVAGFPTQQRIINGSYTTIGQYPFIAGILLTTDYVSFRQVCGGTIINNRSVLSAAHCLYDFATIQIRLRVGSSFANSGGNVHVVSLINNHPNYVSITFNNDISVLRTSTAFSFGTNIQVGRIAGPNYNVGDNQAAWIVGWGLTSTPPDGTGSEQLRHVQIQTVNQGTCAALYGSLLQPNMLCAGGGGHGVCIGDSGGPVIHNNVVVGITSITALPCGDLPAVFARVSSYTDWIILHA